jgi:hypothetical protein
MLHKIWNVIYVKYLNYYIFAGFFRAQSEMARKNRTLMTGRSAHSIERRAQKIEAKRRSRPTCGSVGSAWQGKLKAFNSNSHGNVHGKMPAEESNPGGVE